MYHLTLKSRNVKTGPIPVSTSTAETCPTVCPFNHMNAGGCYAATGPLALHWRKVTEGKAGTSFDRFLAQVAALPDGQLWRHNAAGDLPGQGDDLDIMALSQLIQANRGKRGFAYTHKPLNDGHEQDMIAIANRNGFTINLSANNLSHADELAQLAIAPVVCVLPADATENTTTPQGRKVVVCPATQRDDVSCATCGLCARLRDAIVGFPAHGNGKKKADAIARELAA
jgi:hypothetical protein